MNIELILAGICVLLVVAICLICSIKLLYERLNSYVKSSRRKIGYLYARFIIRKKQNKAKGKVKEDRADSFVRSMQKQLKKEYIAKYGYEAWKKSEEEIKEIFMPRNPEEEKEWQRLVDDLLKEKNDQS